MTKRGREFFIMNLAYELKMTRKELLCGIDSYELTMWAAYFKEVNKPKKPKGQSKETLVGQLKNAFMTRKKGKALPVPKD